MSEEAFQESESSRKSPKSLKLPLKEDGSIDWDTSLEKHKESFLRAIEVDPNGILQNIQEQAGTTPTPSDTGIADATVLAGCNLVMVVEALLLSVFPGPKFLPPLKFVHPVVAIKACTVTMDEIEPILGPGKRLIKRFVPEQYLKQEYQDIAVCAEHLAKIGSAKMKACVELGVEIEAKIRQAQSQAPPPNGRDISQVN